MKAPGPWLAAASLACGGALGVLLGIAMVPTGIQIVAEDPRLREAPGWLGLALGAAEGVWLAGTGVLMLLVAVRLATSRTPSTWALGVASGVVACLSVAGCVGCLPFGAVAVAVLLATPNRRAFGVK